MCEYEERCAWSVLWYEIMVRCEYGCVSKAVGGNDVGQGL